MESVMFISNEIDSVNFFKFWSTLLCTLWKTADSPETRPKFHDFSHPKQLLMFANGCSSIQSSLRKRSHISTEFKFENLSNSITNKRVKKVSNTLI